MAFVSTNIPSVQGTQVLKTPPILAGVQQQNEFIYGHRNATTDPDGLPVIIPDAGFPRYEYYKTYPLPAQYLSDAPAMLSYFQSCGFNVEYGYVNTISLLNASHVDITTFAADDIVRVYYLSSSQLIAPMIGSGITGTFDDTTASVTGVFVSAAIGSFVVSAVTYDSYIDLQSTGFATVDAADNISITFNEPLLVPNPTGTDEFLLNIYSTCQASLIPVNVNSTVATPNVYFSILPNSADSDYFGPTGSALTLSIPTAASGSTVTFAIPSSNVSFIPLSELGNTTITQATSLAVGTVESAVINSGSLVVTLTNITGTFNATNLCTLHLDAAQDIFVHQQAYFAQRNLSLRYVPCIYQINSASDITTTYARIFAYVASLNLPATSQAGQAICHVVFGNKSISKNLAVTTLPTNVNNYQYVPIWYNYTAPQVGDLPLTIGQLVCASTMVLASNVSPNNPQGGVVLNGIPVLQNDQKWVGTEIGGVADQVEALGWNAVCVNGNQQAFLVSPRTGLTTVPGTSVPNKEYAPTYFWDTLNQLRLGITLICQSSGIGQVRQTDTVKGLLKSDIVAFMLGMEGTQLQNVLANEALITIVEDPTNPLGLDIVIPSQVIPGLENINYTINVFSATVNL